jgi:hypothetical protein
MGLGPSTSSLLVSRYADTTKSTVQEILTCVRSIGRDQGLQHAALSIDHQIEYLRNLMP